ncbi:dynein light chain [Acrasis kona]|uniref:Dynein light chain n=1 Tax=Acrasis kona TaxID=1008807 RepID=A0AAW2YYJ4_9EUKA
MTTKNEDTDGVLLNEEIEECREIFNKHKTKDGYMEMWHLRAALRAIKVEIIEEQLFKIINDIRKDCTNEDGNINFQQFLRIVGAQKGRDLRWRTDIEAISAFTALGGNPDRSGYLAADILREACNEFGLIIDIDALIKEVDVDGNGQIDFDEFSSMIDMSTPTQPNIKPISTATPTSGTSPSTPTSVKSISTTTPTSGGSPSTPTSVKSDKPSSQKLSPTKRHSFRLQNKRRASNEDLLSILKTFQSTRNVLKN